MNPVRGDATGGGGLPHALRERARAHGAEPVFLQKRHGVWRSWSWQEVDACVDSWARGLLGAGLAPGDAVGVVSGARVEAVLVVHACQRAGLLPVLLSPGMGAGGLASLAAQARVRAFVLEDQEQVDKVAEVGSRLGALQALWVIDPKGTRSYRHVSVRPLDHLSEAAGPQPCDPAAATEDAVVLFSAGVFGEPRPVTVTQATLRDAGAAVPSLGLAPGARCASLYGLADPTGHFLAVVAPVLCGTVACFGEGRLPSVPELRECAPRVLALPARWVDAARRDIDARAQRAGTTRQAIIAAWRARSRPTAPWHLLVGDPLTRMLGLGNCRLVLTGGEMLPPAGARFLQRLGLRVRALYTLAEAGGPVGAFDADDAALLQPWPGFTARVDAAGALTLAFDGREVATGDLVAPGPTGSSLRWRGRAADLLTLPDGSLLPPSVVESELAGSAGVARCVATGGPAGGVRVLVELDEPALRAWARASGQAYTTWRSLADGPQVRALIDAAVTAANLRLPPAARIVQAVLLPRPLEAANGELTSALAVRRAIVRNRYAHRLVGAITRE